MNSTDNLCNKLMPYVISALQDDSVIGPSSEWSLIERVRVDFYTQLIASSWSEVLRWTYKEKGETKLRECLLPEDLGSAHEVWVGNIFRTPAIESKIEGLLKNFGMCEIKDKFDLPYDISIVREADGYKLKESK